MELYDEKYVKNYIMNKKNESYYYLEKKKEDYVSYYIQYNPTIYINSYRIGEYDWTYTVRKAIWNDFNIHRLKICFQKFNNVQKEDNSKWRKVHLFSFLLLEEQIQEHSEICNYYLEELVTYIKKNSRKNAVHHILSYLISKNFEQSDVYTDELVMTYLKAVENHRYSCIQFNKIYPLLSLYIHEKKLENHLTLLEKLEHQKDLLREDVKEFTNKIKSYKTLKEEVAVSQSEKGEDGKINMKKVPRNKYNGKKGVKTMEEDELNNGTKEMPILDDSKEQVNQRIKEILEALDYSDKQGLKMKLEELKKWTMELRELQLFYNQLNELISLGNYEDDDNQKKLLKFIDTYLKK